MDLWNTARVFVAVVVAVVAVVVVVVVVVPFLGRRGPNALRLLGRRWRRLTGVFFDAEQSEVGVQGRFLGRRARVGVGETGVLLDGQRRRHVVAGRTADGRLDAVLRRRRRDALVQAVRRPGQGRRAALLGRLGAQWTLRGQLLRQFDHHWWRRFYQRARSRRHVDGLRRRRWLQGVRARS